jgi:hypothetical protein
VEQVADRVVHHDEGRGRVEHAVRGEAGEAVEGGADEESETFRIALDEPAPLLCVCDHSLQAAHRPVDSGGHLLGRPLPGNRNDCTAFTESGIDSACGRATVLADGGYQGTGALIPHRRKAGQDRLEGWKAGHNASHRRVRARIEHAFARMKNWKILRDRRRRGEGVYWAASGIACMHNLALDQ